MTLSVSDLPHRIREREDSYQLVLTMVDTLFARAFSKWKADRKYRLKKQAQKQGRVA